MLPQRLVAYHCALGQLDHELGVALNAQVHRAEWLGDPSLAHEQRQVVVLSLHMLSDFVLNPLKGDSLFEDLLQEGGRLAFAAEDEEHVIACDLLLEDFLGGAAVFVGQA